MQKMMTKCGLFFRVSELADPKDRMIAMARWYLSTLNASKKVMPTSKAVVNIHNNGLPHG